MKRCLLILFLFCSFAPLSKISAQQPSRVEILATVEHIQRLARDQQAQLAQAIKDQQAKDQMIAWQADQITNLTLWGNRCEQAVKAIAMALAIAISVWIGTAFAGEILKNFPSFEGPVAAALLYICIFLATYYGVMSCIFAIAPHVPTVPVWHDIHAWIGQFHAPKIR